MPPLSYPYYKAKRATMTATQAFSVTGAANVTELVLPIEAGARYYLDAYITYLSAATTTGLGLGFVGSASSRFMSEIFIPLTTSGSATGLSMVIPNSAVVNSGASVSSGVGSIALPQTAIIRGILVVGATGGTIQLVASSEVAASAVTLQIGSELVIQRFE
jgi:hypothetical protein